MLKRWERRLKGCGEEARGAASARTTVTKRCQANAFLLSSFAPIASTPARIRLVPSPLRRAVSCCAREWIYTSESSRASSDTHESPRPLSASVHARLVFGSERVRRRLLCQACQSSFPCYAHSLFDLIVTGSSPMRVEFRLGSLT